MSMNPRYDPSRHRPMNSEFARRIRSFLSGGIWSQIAQLAQADMGCDDVWTVIVGGIPNMSGEDNKFAESINWCAKRRDFDLSNVDNYEYGNWWYVDAGPGSPPGAVIAVTGDVRLNTAPATDDEARQKARAFVQAVLDPSKFVLNPPGVGSKVSEDRLTISGTVYFR